MLTIQTALNTQMRMYLHSPFQPAFFFLIGTIVLAVMVMLQSAPKPQLNELAQIPWHLWLGGLIGVYAISMSIYTAPKWVFSFSPDWLFSGNCSCQCYLTILAG